jgi:hypothetical protein
MRGLSRSSTILRSLTVLGVLVAACNPAEKASAPATPATPTVDEIVAGNLTARGGEAKLRALRSIRESGTVTASDGRVARVVREIARPDLFRLQFTFQGTTSVFAYDGKASWQVAPLQGQFEPQAMPPELDATSGADQRDLEGPLVDWRKKGHAIELVGREKIDGKEAWKLKVVLAGGTVRYDYVDVETHLLVRSDVQRRIRGHMVEMQNRFSDFREVAGLVFPHAISVQAKDRPQSLHVVVEKIELDPAIDEASFRMPQ